MKTANIMISIVIKNLIFLYKNFTISKALINLSNEIIMFEHLFDDFQSNEYPGNIYIILKSVSTPPPYKNEEFNKLIEIINKKYNKLLFHKINLLIKNIFLTPLFLSSFLYVKVCWYARTQGKDAIRYLTKQIISWNKINNEYYLYSIYNRQIKYNEKITSINIDKKPIYDVSKLEDLKTYLFFKGEK